MADIEPTYYNVAPMDVNGVNQGDILKAIYNLSEAVIAICNNLDADSGTLGTDYMSKIGTNLETAMANLHTPPSGGTT